MAADTQRAIVACAGLATLALVLIINLTLKGLTL